MKCLQDFEKAELTELINPSFRAKQIYQWIYQKYADDFSQMQNLPKQMRESLACDFYINPLKVLKSEKSKDGTIKYLFGLRDHLSIESVLLPMKTEQFHEDGARKSHARYTICISSQVGCKIGCSFCFTAKGGFKRNLSPAEIVAQVTEIKKLNNISSERRVNIVFMGMGEPLDNIINVSKAVRIFSDIDGLSISPKRQTISTSGLSSQITKLANMNLGANLAISLHAVDDKLRAELMPINKAYNIKSIIDAVRSFPYDTRKKVMFEYLVLKDINDDLSSAKKLAKLLNGLRAKVNLIYFNPHEGSSYKRPDKEKVEAFCQFLNKSSLTCTIRESKGIDVSAACGQLKERSEHDMA